MNSKPPDKTGRPLARIAAGIFVAAVVFVLYLSALAPGVMYYARPNLLDAATLQVHAATLGITHPTGYPTWALITHLFTYLPVGDLAYRTNLSSAVYSAGAVSLVYAAGLALSKRMVAAAVGALAFGLGAAFWSQALIAEIYNLNALFVALFFTLLLAGRERLSEDRKAGGYLLAAAFVAGLSLTNHMTSAAVLLGGAAFIKLTGLQNIVDKRLALRATLLFALGLLPYLYLPVRAAMGAPLQEADPDSIGGFIRHVSGTEVSGVLLGKEIGELPSRAALYAGSVVGEFGWPLLALAVLGFFHLISRDRAAVALLGIPLAIWLVYNLLYDIPDLTLYFIPTYLVAALWVSAGSGALLEAFESRLADIPRSRRQRGHWRAGTAAMLCVSAALVLLPFTGLPETYAEVDRSEDRRGREIIETVAAETEPGATVLHNRSSLWYMVLVEERRRDLTLLDPFKPGEISSYDLVWPGHLSPQQAASRYSTDDNTGVEAARRAAQEGPVYILDQQSADASAFLEAGFEIIPVKEGILYRLEPPGRKDAAHGAVVRR